MIFLLSFISTGICQDKNQEIDSVDFYIGSAKPYLFKNLDSSWLYIQKAQAIANHGNDRFSQAKVLGMTGIYYDVSGEYDSALIFYNEAAEIYLQANEKFQYANILNNAGYTYFNTGQYEKASINYQKAIAAYEELGEVGKEARTLNNLGLVFEDIGDNDRALKTFEASIQKSLISKDTSGYYYAMNGKASILSSLEQNRLALVFLDSVSNYFREVDEPYHLARSLKNAGDCSIELGELDRAEGYFKESLVLKKQFNSEYDVYTTLLSLADLYLNQKKYELALNYTDSALMKIEKSDLESLAKINRMKGTIFREEGDFKSSAKYLYNYANLSDSLVSIETTATITELNNKYEVAKKDKEIAELALENEISQSEIYESRVRFYGLGGLLLIVILFSLIYLYSIRKQHKLSRALLHEEIDGLRLRIGKIISDIQLDDLQLDTEKLQNDLPNTLTDREVQILQVAITNKSNGEIADEVYLSVNTVKYHLKNIYAKLGVSTRLEAREALAKIN